MREEILKQMKLKGVKQKDVVEGVRRSGTKLTNSSLSNFLNGKKGINLRTYESIVNYLSGQEV